MMLIAFGIVQSTSQDFTTFPSLIFFISKDAFGAKPETFHIFGHSLGSHIAGYAGEQLSSLGRITGRN